MQGDDERGQLGQASCFEVMEKRKLGNGEDCYEALGKSKERRTVTQTLTSDNIVDASLIGGDKYLLSITSTISLLPRILCQVGRRRCCWW